MRLTGLQALSVGRNHLGDVHGTEDTDVPYELSAAMAKELERHKVRHELVTVPGAGHGLSGGDRKLIDEAHTKALAYIRGQLNAK